LARLQQASYCALLLEQTTETEAVSSELFGQYSRLLAMLAKEIIQPQTVFAFEMKLLEELGLRPRLEETKLSAGARRILEQMAAMEWEAVWRLRLSEAQVKEIGRFLHGFMIYHLGKIPAGRSAALAEGERQ
jgi:hypothetical protein